MPRTLTPSEAQIAIAFVDYVNSKHPNLSEDLIKIDNENKCSWAEGKKKKRMGKRKGASDYFFSRSKRYSTEEFDEFLGGKYLHGRLYFGLWLEIKSAKGKESPEQKEFGQRQLRNGYQYKCVYSVDEAIAAFEEYIS